MVNFEQKLKDFILANDIKAEHLVFKSSCHSVKEAAEAAGASTEEFIKNICMIDNVGNLIVAIVKGSDRASTTKVGKALGIERPRTANETEILEKTGYPCGGVPSFGYSANFLIDGKVMEMDIVYTGGGSTHSLVRMDSNELMKANKGLICDISK